MSPGFRGIPLNYQERRIYHWHEELDRRIGIQRIPEELRVQPRLEPLCGELTLSAPLGRILALGAYVPRLRLRARDHRAPRWDGCSRRTRTRRPGSARCATGTRMH